MDTASVSIYSVCTCNNRDISKLDQKPMRRSIAKLFLRYQKQFCNHLLNLPFLNNQMLT